MRRRHHLEIWRQKRVRDAEKEQITMKKVKKMKMKKEKKKKKMMKKKK